MRAIATVHGVGSRKAGIGKTSGKKYDFTEVSLSFPHPDFSGEKCVVVGIDSAIMGDRILNVGEKIDVVLHESNFKTYVDAIIG